VLGLLVARRVSARVASGCLGGVAPGVRGAGGLAGALGASSAPLGALRAGPKTRS